MAVLPAGLRQHQAAARHWEQQLRAMPPCRLTGLGDPLHPRYRSAELRSVALGHAVTAIAARYQADTAPVLLTAYAFALARLTGVSGGALLPLVSNRFRPGLGDVVSMIAQTGIFVLDVAGLTFAEALDRTRRAAMTAYKHAYYDPVAIAELAAHVQAERGPEYHVSCFFNDRRAAIPAAPEVPPGPEVIAAALSRTEFEPTISRHEPYRPVVMHVGTVTLADRSDAIALELNHDTHALSTANARALLSEVERAAIEAARDIQIRVTARG